MAKFITDAEKISLFDKIFKKRMETLDMNELGYYVSNITDGLPERYTKWINNITKGEQELLDLVKEGKEIRRGNGDDGSYYYYPTGRKNKDGSLEIAYVSARLIGNLRKKGFIR